MKHIRNKCKAYQLWGGILVTSLIVGCAATESSQWVRTSTPVLRDPIVGENYEVASDPHVVFDQAGNFRMIYSGDDSGIISIKLAIGSDWTTWLPSKTLLGPSTTQSEPKHKETPFFFQAADEYQIYFIGYEDEATYESQVYLAVSDSMEGPYRIFAEPVIPRGLLAGRQVHLITSPSIVEHDGLLHMAFLGWDDFTNVTQVWVFGAVSSDNGRSWNEFREIEIPIGMEGQITPKPEGGYIAVRSGDFRDSEALFIAESSHPFGPYSIEREPILIRSGAPWEVDEITAPQITFNPKTNEPVLFYTGANHKKGWWILQASQPRQERHLP